MADPSISLLIQSYFNICYVETLEYGWLLNSY